MLAIGFTPNIGGIETHFDDFLKITQKNKISLTVLTYQPLETRTKGEVLQRRPFVTVVRIPIIRGLFYRFVKYPFLEFLYLFPSLFIVTPFVLIVRNSKVIHAHGIIAGFVGCIWAIVFRKKMIISTHSIYQFPKSSLYTNIACWVFQNADSVLALSRQSKNEIIALGIPENKIKTFTYWVDQKVFLPLNKNTCRALLKLDKKFIVLFVGRLVEEKGLIPLMVAASNWKDSICLLIAGVGPLEENVKKAALKNRNIIFLGGISQESLPSVYNSADLLIVPSLNEEGFGRVIIEALSCGIPVVATNRGGVPEAMDNSVGKIIDITSENIQKTIEYFYTHPNILREKATNALKFAKLHYTENNANVILQLYKQYSKK